MIILLALVALGISTLGGVLYVLGQLLPALRTAEREGRTSNIHYYELAAAPIFVAGQAVAFVFLWLRRPDFLWWLIPPALYLSLIGLLCWWRLGRREMLALDFGRGVTLLGLGVLAWFQLEVTVPA